MELADIWIFGIGIVLVMLLILAMVNSKKIGDGIERWMVNRAMNILERHIAKTEARWNKEDALYAAQEAKAQTRRGNRPKPSSTEENP